MDGPSGKCIGLTRWTPAKDPVCVRFGMGVAAQEVRDGKPGFISFRCGKCGRSEKLICEE
jgi:hypothetical protein